MSKQENETQQRSTAKWIPPIISIFVALGGLFAYFDIKREQAKQEIDLTRHEAELRKADLYQDSSIFANTKIEPDLSIDILSDKHDGKGKLEYIVDWSVLVQNTGKNDIAINCYKIGIYHGIVDKEKLNTSGKVEINHPDENEGDIAWTQLNLIDEYTDPGPREKSREKIATGKLIPGDGVFGSSSMIFKALPGEIVFVNSWLEYSNLEESADSINDKEVCDDGDQFFYYEFDWEILPDLE
ncbi:MAG: hypothetical protein AAF572_01040 [Cyanobacteria bacterium P01_B01_bin.77]